jgi:hypothetical protein
VLFVANAAEATSNSVELDGGIDPDEPQSALFTVTQARNEPVYLTCDEIDTGDDSHLVQGNSDNLQTLVIRGLKADTHYHCAAFTDHKSNTVNIWTDPLPADLAVPEITIPADPAETGYTLMNAGDFYFDPATASYLSARNYLVIVDAEGNIRWYYGGPGAGDIDASYFGAEGILFAGQHDTPGNPNDFFPPTFVGLNKQPSFPVASAAIPGTTLSGARELPGS